MAITYANEISRTINGKRWTGEAMLINRELAKKVAKFIRNLGLPCRMVTLAGTGTFGVVERYVLVVPSRNDTTPEEEYVCCLISFRRIDDLLERYHDSSSIQDVDFEHPFWMFKTNRKDF